MVSEKAASNGTDASIVEESSQQQVSNDSDISSKVGTETHRDYSNCLRTTVGDVDMQTETTLNEHPNCKGVNNVSSSDVRPSETCNQDNASVVDTSSVSAGSTSVTEQSSQSHGSLLTPPAGDPSVRIKLLARVAVSDAHFKHQQRGDPDLTMEEKIEIAQKILDENKVKFLSKFSEYLEIEDLEYFSDSRHIYEIDFYCKQVLKSKSSDYCKNRVKNRRYEAMKKLVCEGEYFSEEEMKFRDPYLYDQMVGQFLTDEEIQAQVDKSDLRLSSILTRHLDLLDENARFARDRDKEVRAIYPSLVYPTALHGHWATTDGFATTPSIHKQTNDYYSQLPIVLTPIQYFFGYKTEIFPSNTIPKI